MHPHVNYGIKLLREAGKKVARFYDELTEHWTQTRTHEHQNPSLLLETAAEKIYQGLIKLYPDELILDLKAIPDQPPAEGWLYHVVCGTENFAENIPFFSLTLSYRAYGQIQHAVVYDPLRDEAFYASRGAGAQLNGRKLRLQLTNKSIFINEAALKTAQDLKRTYRCFGSENLEICYVAANRGSLAAHHLPNGLSTAPARFIAREAGATCFVFKEHLFLTAHIDDLKKLINELQSTDNLLF